jgi:hypothetical protein
MTEIPEPPPTHDAGSGFARPSSDGDGESDKEDERNATLNDDEKIAALTKAIRLLQGPRITSPKSARSPLPVPEFAAFFSRHGRHEAKMTACRGLQATVVDFFVGASEQRIQVTPSVYDLIYGSGPHAIMNAARDRHSSDLELSFRWYHLPANNVCSLLLCHDPRESANFIPPHEVGMGRGRTYHFYHPFKQGLTVSRISWNSTWPKVTVGHGFCLRSSSTNLVYLDTGTHGPKLDDCHLRDQGQYSILPRYAYWLPQQLLFGPWLTSLHIDDDIDVGDDAVDCIFSAVSADGQHTSPLLLTHLDTVPAF